MRRLAPFLLALLLPSTGCYESHFPGDAETPDAPPPRDASADVLRFAVGLRDSAVPDAPPRDTSGDVMTPFDGGPTDAGEDTPPIFDAGPPDTPPICDPATCPPSSEPTCLDDNTLRVFGEPFCNDDNMCDAPEQDFVCELGCADGACIEVCDEWLTTEVSGIGRSAGTTSLGIGRENIYIAYGEGGDNELRVANYRAGVWGLEAVGQPIFAATTGALAVDPSDGLHVVLSPPRSVGLRYSSRTADGNWRNSALPGVTGRRVATLAIDSLGGVHVAFNNDGNIGSMSLRDGRWTRQDLFGMGYAGANSIDVHLRGRTPVVHLVAEGDGPFPAARRLQHARREGDGAWIVTELEAPAASQSAALAIGPDARPIIVSMADGVLRTLTQQMDGSWTMDEAMAPGGTFLDLAIDRAGGLHLAFRDGTSDSLGYANRPAGGDWSFEIPLDTPGTGSDASIGFGLGGVHISHQNARTRQLLYTRRVVCDD